MSEEGEAGDLTRPAVAPVEVEYLAVIAALDRSIERHSWYAWIIGFVALGGSVAGIWFLHDVFVNDLSALETAKDPTTVLAFVLVRGAALAVAVTSVLYGVLSLARASLDQVTRFEKRLVSARFLHFILDQQKPAIDAGSLDLKSLREFMESWNETIESAYSKVKFGSRKAQGVTLKADKNGFLYATSDPDSPQHAAPASGSRT